MKLKDLWPRTDISIGEAVYEFRRKAGRPAETGDVAELRALFARYTARARMANKEDQWAVKEDMRETLRDVLLEPSRRVKTGWFDDV